MENKDREFWKDMENWGIMGHNVFNGHIDGEKLQKSGRKITKGMEMGGTVYGEK